MAARTLKPGELVAFGPEGLDELLAALRSAGYEVHGPRVRAGAIVIEPVTARADLPVGWVDRQEKGTYRLERGAAPTYFGFVVGPESWKKIVHPSRRRLWRAERRDGRLRFLADEPEKRRLAFLGVRGCDLKALDILCEVRAKGGLSPEDEASVEPFLVAVECARAAATCFCASMGTGPGIDQGFDVRLSESWSPEEHVFLAAAGSERGARVLSQVTVKAAPEDATQRIEAQRRETARQQTRSLDTRAIDAVLAASLESPQWDDVAERCLSCANCTLVCPTCFCTTTEETTDLTGDHAERWLRWDSCFTLDHAYVHGGSIRPSRRSRYRQWLTHKLGTWIAQFGTSGCVGCGRCIAWCPVGIDLTEEMAGIRSRGDGGHPLAGREDA